MKIIEETPARLVIVDRPIVLGLALVTAVLVDLAVVFALAQSGEWAGVGMLGLGALLLLGAFAAFVRRTDLVLDRTTGVARLTSATMMGRSVKHWPLDEVTGGAVQTNRNGSGSTTRRPALALRDGGQISLTPVYTSGRGPDRAATTINRWLAGETPGT